MKTINIEIIDTYSGKSDINCELKLTSLIEGVKGEVTVLLNNDGYVSVSNASKSPLLHSLVGNGPFKTEFVEMANNAIQTAFKKWDKTTNFVEVNI